MKFFLGTPRVLWRPHEARPYNEKKSLLAIFTGVGAISTVSE